MKKTLVVNLIAAPGVGKSTMASDIFARLKWAHIDCEIVTEFAKELVWEERHSTFKNEVYIFAKQFHRLFRVNEKVDVIITDRPLLLSMFYNQKYGQGCFNKLDALVLEQHHSFNNLNIFLNRVKQYNPNGRNQSEEESDEMGIEIQQMLDDNGIGYLVYDGSRASAIEISRVIQDIVQPLN